MPCALHQSRHISTSCWWFAGFQITDRVHWTYHVNFIKHIQQNYNYLQNQSMGIFFVGEGRGGGGDFFVSFFLTSEFVLKTLLGIIFYERLVITAPFKSNRIGETNQSSSDWLAWRRKRYCTVHVFHLLSLSHTGLCMSTFHLQCLVPQRSNGGFWGNLVYLSLEQAWQREKKKKKRNGWGRGVDGEEERGVIFVSTPTMLHLCLSHTPEDHPLREREGSRESL